MPRIFVTPWASSSRPGSVRAARAVGQDDLAIRSGQLRSSPPRLTRTRCCSRIDRVTLALANRGSAPRSASCDGPPAPHRLEQPSPWRNRSLTSHVVLAGTTSPVPGPAGSWLDARLATYLEHSPARPRPSSRRTLRWHRANDQDAFRRVASDRVTPTAFALSAIWWKALHGFAHRSHLGAAARVRQHIRAESSSASATCDWVALRLLSSSDARCVGPTSAISRSSYEHPRLVGSRRVRRLRVRAIEEIACITFRPIRFGGSHVVSFFGVVPVGVVFPPWRVQTEPLTTPVASPMGSHRSRGMRLHESRQDRPHRVRVNEARCRSHPGCLPSSKDRRPATPSRTPGSGLRLHCDLAAAMQEIDAFSPLLTLASHQEPVSRPRVPLPPETRFSEPRRSLPTSATISTRGHTRRAFDPRTRVRLSPRYSPAPTDAGCVGIRRALPHGEPASHRLHARAFASRAPLAWTSQTVGRSTRAKANRAIVDDSRVPSSWCIEHPGRRTESSWGLEDLASPRSGLGLSRMPPREGWHRWKDRGAFRRAGTLTRSEDCSSVRARIGAPSRLLLRGIAWELSRLFHRFCRASLWREKRSKQRDLCEPATENRVGLGRP